MAAFTIFGAQFPGQPLERILEIDQIVVTGTDGVRDALAARLAADWLTYSNGGIIEFRNAAGTVLIRLTQP